MANDKVETTFRNIVPEFTKYSSNMFSKIVGSKYAKKFHEVYYSDIESRDSKMKALYEEAKEDTTLKDYQKKIIDKCYIAYLAAVGANGNMSLPILIFLEKKKPAILKILNSDTRTKRMMWDLQDVITSNGFYLDVYNFPDLLKVFMVQFRQKDESELHNNDYWFERVILAALSQFTRVLPRLAIPTIWYALMFMKNIASLAYIKEDTFNNNEHIKPQVISIMKTLYAMNIMENKRITSKAIEFMTKGKPKKKEEASSTSK